MIKKQRRFFQRGVLIIGLCFWALPLWAMTLCEYGRQLVVEHGRPPASPDDKVVHFHAAGTKPGAVGSEEPGRVEPMTDLNALKTHLADRYGVIVVVDLDAIGDHTELLKFMASRPDCAFIGVTDVEKMDSLDFFSLKAKGFRNLISRKSSSRAEEIDSAIKIQRTRNQSLPIVFAETGVISISPTMVEVYRLLYQAANSPHLVVYIEGETGTGKEAMAQATHLLGPQSKAVFRVQNCGLLDKGLAASVLFGHEKGAFTGADKPRLGLFREAEGGTVVLDEIQSLDPDVQAMLLEALQYRRAKAVGADKPYNINIRVIALSNKPLADLVKEGKFREDLAQRLQFQVKLPPLRERPEDIVIQAKYFLRLAQPNQVTITDISPQVLDTFKRMRWTGNSRQLENLMAYIVAVKTSGSVVTMDDLPAWVAEELKPAPAASSALAATSDGGEVFTLKIDPDNLVLANNIPLLEKELIVLALARYKTQAAAALKLGISRATLREKMTKHGLRGGEE